MGKSTERRKHSRVELPCRLCVELPSGKDLRARTVNVCDGGAYFVADQSMEVGKKVYIRLTVPRDTANTFFLEQFAAQARVIRCDPSGEGRGGTGVALRFEKELSLDLA